MAPIVHGLEAEYGDRMIFTYLDIDDSRTQSFKLQLGYRYQPHFFLLGPDGDILQQWVGFVSEDNLESALVDALSQ